MLTCEQIEEKLLAAGPVTKDNFRDAAFRLIPPVETRGWLKRIPRRRWDESIPEVQEALRAIGWRRDENTWIGIAVLHAALNQRDARLVEMAKAKGKNNG